MKLSISWKVGSLKQELRRSYLWSSSMNRVPHSSHNLNLFQYDKVNTPTQIIQSSFNQRETRTPRVGDVYGCDKCTPHEWAIYRNIPSEGMKMTHPR